MRETLSVFLLAEVVATNIIFTHVPLTCNLYNGKLYYGCLRGQYCDDNSTCQANPTNAEFVYQHGRSLSSLKESSMQRNVLSTDGTCGRDNGDTICDPDSDLYTGNCCSQYGWCGGTEDHCDTGCQSGNCVTVTVTKTLTTSGGPSDERSTTGEPKIGAVTATLEAAAAATAAITSDGSCGSSKGGTICGNWPNGNCCSMYGFCGSTTSHCGAGCQSGNCSSTISTAPGAGPAPANAVPGDFKVIGLSGVPAMHAALMANGRVIFLDKVENFTQLTLPNGHFAMSSEYDPANNTVVPLAYKTNAFCCGGAFLADGRLLSVGGNAPLIDIDDTIGDGFNAIRYIERSSTNTTLDGTDWAEPGNKLASKRWYATAQTMPDGTIFVASGSLNGLDPTVKANNNPTYEILSTQGVSQGQNIPLEILTKNEPYYMYPFVHLLKDGSLFIFASKSSERFSVSTNTTLQTYPDLAGDYRTYPNTGGSVMLPLSSANEWTPKVIICGGGAYQDITSPTDASCGTIEPLATNPTWEMDSMPEGRGQVEGTLLPDGTIIWLNGGQTGSQGFGLMTNPTLEALMYNATASLGARFSKLGSSTIPRLYHSVSLLLLDGTLMVAGSNPVEQPVLVATTANPYITEFRVERYTPPYLQGDKATTRPANVKLSRTTIAPAQTFTVEFIAKNNNTKVEVVLYHGGFVTHSLHMGHRMLICDTTGYSSGSVIQKLTVSVPPDSNVVPPGPYVVYVMVDGVPSVGQFVKVTT